MTVYPSSNTQIAGRFRKLAELYKNGQVSDLTAQTINKLLDYEISQTRKHLQETEADLVVYEKQFGLTTIEFFARYQAGQTDDSAESVEWASLAQMAERLRQRLEFLSIENPK
jgi:hypothetical protein